MPSHRQVKRDVDALNREERRLARLVAADKRHLHRFERADHSQNGEDGLIAEIFARIGTTERAFIEIGASDGTENCTAALVEQGWGGVWVEGDPDKAAAACPFVGLRPVAVAEVFVDRDSILTVLQQAGASPEPDLLVIDIDGNDYWMWETVASAHSGPGRGHRVQRAGGAEAALGDAVRRRPSLGRNAPSRGGPGRSCGPWIEPRLHPGGLQQ